MRPCAATNCRATMSEPVWTRRGRMDVCSAHRQVLADAGEIIDGPPPSVGIVLDPDAAHRNAIKAGMEEARQAGTHIGRKPVPVPAEAIEAVVSGMPLKAAARKFRVEKTTLGRRVAAAKAAPAVSPPAPTLAPPSDPVPTSTDVAGAVTEAARLLGEATKLQAKGEAEVRAGQAKIEEARAIAKKARAMLECLGA